ncbi:hypothetical protein [Amycolatopsis sp. cmx-11-12]|uniref:hypothetical protein n=1 Tax=Amycolatopsis sp. cmx-11-12 TaxID=2785795 RepID=UPI003916F823
MENPITGDEAERRWDTYLVARREETSSRRSVSELGGEAVALLAHKIRRGHPEERAAALDLSADDPDLAAALIDSLLWLSVTHAWAGRVRQVLDNIPSFELFPMLTQRVPELLDQALIEEDEPYDDFRRFAELLEHVRHWHLLGELVGKASESADADVREVVEDYEKYRHLWSFSRGDQADPG